MMLYAGHITTFKKQLLQLGNEVGLEQNPRCAHVSLSNPSFGLLYTYMIIPHQYYDVVAQLSQHRENLMDSSHHLISQQKSSHSSLSKDV